VNLETQLPTGQRVVGLCLDTHDLAISKYVAHRDKDKEVTRQLAQLQVTKKSLLLERLAETKLSDDPEEDAVLRRAITGYIAADFYLPPVPDTPGPVPGPPASGR
jgi:predicted transcriptional regulator